MVLQERIELSTSPLPRGCSTTELLQRSGREPATAVARAQDPKTIQQAMAHVINRFAPDAAFAREPSHALLFFPLGLAGQYPLAMSPQEVCPHAC